MGKSAFLQLALVAVSTVSALNTCSAGSSTTPAAPVRVNYARPFEPPTRPAFLPLPPGAVEPTGWLRDWCLAARDGFTGHMDEYDDEFKRAWAPDHKMTGEGLFWYKGAWPYEGGGYWFDGLARLGFALHDESLIQQAHKRFYAVADNMNTNGLLFLWWLDRNNPGDRKAVTAALEGWPLWACGLLGRAMTGFYSGSGDKHILVALEKAYGADPECLRSITGNMSNPWPTFDTYCWTGNRGIADALDAMFKKQEAGLLPNLNRYRKAPDLNPGTTVDNAHVVEFIECTTPWAVGYLWTGDKRYLQAAIGWHDLLERVAMQPYGVPVSDEWYGPTGAFRGSETCDVAGYVWSQVCLLSVTGEGRMADRLERAFFNAGPATVSRDFKSHVYFQSPNRFANLSPDFPHGPRAGGGAYQPKHSPLCCTAALNRIVPWFVTHMWMATYDNGLAATCYGPCKVTALAADRVPVVIVCKTDYPFNDTVDISVDPARESAFPLDFHIPGWCSTPTLSVNGSAIVVECNAKGFARVSRSWKPGDTVRLRLPMTASVQRGRDAASGPPYSGAHSITPVTIPEETSARGVPYASVSYGPLLFALPIPDITNANTPDPSARWQFALDVQKPGLSVERIGMPARWDWPLSAPLKLRANVVEVVWNPDPKAPRLPLLPVARSKAPEPVTLIPYGCTKFRISMFPVTAEPEVKLSGIRRILFLGNSITLHGPKADIGWAGNWGMAASAAEKDYVHLVTAEIARAAGARPETKVRNIAEFERQYNTYDIVAALKADLDFNADIIIVAIGENVPSLGSDTAKANYAAAFARFLAEINKPGRAAIFVRGCFWPDPAKDEIMKQASADAGVTFVDIASLGRDESNAARAERQIEHAGVAGHPGDKGMRAIADAIWSAIQKHTSLPTEAEAGWPDRLIGYTELQTDLPGGRHANVRTMRAALIKADGSGRRPLAADLADEPDAWTQFAGWSPDGAQAIVARGWQSSENAKWEEGHKTFRFTQESWRLDSYLVDLAGKAENVTAVERVSFYNAGLFFWPDDPSKLGFTALIDGSSHPFRMDRDGRNKIDLTKGSKEFTYGFTSSRDGKRISYHKRYQVFLADADVTHAVQVQTGHSFNFGPTWSPDGRWVLFLSGEHHNCHPYIVRADGTGLKKLADRAGYSGVVEFLDVPDFHEGSSDTPVWSADGKRIFYTAKDGPNVELFQAPIDGVREQLTRSPKGTFNYHPEPSSDGHWLVYGSKRDGVRQLFALRLEDRVERQLTDLKPGHAAMWPHWRPVSKQGQ